MKLAFGKGLQKGMPLFNTVGLMLSVIQPRNNASSNKRFNAELWVLMVLCFALNGLTGLASSSLSR